LQRGDVGLDLLQLRLLGLPQILVGGISRQHLRVFEALLLRCAFRGGGACGLRGGGLAFGRGQFARDVAHYLAVVVDDVVAARQRRGRNGVAEVHDPRRILPTVVHDRRIVGGSNGRHGAGGQQQGGQQEQGGPTHGGL